jgi:DNA-binding CsgD family transcriptional regulator
VCHEMSNRVVANPAVLRLMPRRSCFLSRRQVETLGLLLSGLSEKEIAAALRLSINTVHHYVKTIHVRFAVQTRAELMARFVPDVRGVELVNVIKAGKLLTQRATAGTWARLCACPLPRLGAPSTGNGRRNGRVRGLPPRLLKLLRNAG